LAETGVNKAKEDLVRDLFSVFKGFLNLNFDSRVLFSLNFDKFSRGNIYYTESLSEKLGLSGTSRAGWAEEDNTWGSAGSSIAVAELEHLVEVLLGVIDWAVGIKFKDKLLEAVTDCVDVHSVVSIDLDSEFLKLLTVNGGVLDSDLLLDALEGLGLADVEVNELVRDNAETLESEGLHFGAGETLNEPGIVGSLVLGDLSLNKLDDNFIVNCNRW
jgi:hypothetical protein